jgi:hypothetical protein
LWKNESVDDHHRTWKNEELPWLHPDGIPLKKQFRKPMEDSHKIELESTVWNHDKVKKTFILFETFSIILRALF